MTQLEIEELLIKSVMQLQELSGRSPATITPDSVPLEELEDFDSLNGVEVTVDIFEQIELEIEFNNIFVLDDKPLSIRDAAARISEHVVKAGKKDRK
jgi:acyl carrier protein